GRPQPRRGPPRARCAADRRAVPVQLEEGRSDAVHPERGGLRETIMSIDQLKDRIPDYAKDLRINLGVIAGATALTPQQAWGTAVAAAVTSRNKDLLAAVLADAGAHLTPEAADAAKGAAAIMGMNNVYYRFVH